MNNLSKRDRLIREIKQQRKVVEMLIKEIREASKTIKLQTK